MLKFRKDIWKNPVVIFDECDVLYKANDDVRSSFLGMMRGIKNAKEYYAILSCVFIGPFSILHLNSDKITVSPFNVKDPFSNPNFTLEQVQTLYKEFEDNFKLTIDPEIIKDIYNRTNGYVKLIGELCVFKI